MKIKNLSAALTALLVLFQFSACSAKPHTPSSDTTTADTTVFSDITEPITDPPSDDMVAITPNTVPPAPYKLWENAERVQIYAASNILITYYHDPSRNTVVGYISQSMAPYVEQNPLFNHCQYFYYFKIENDTLFCWDGVPYSQTHSLLPRPTVNMVLKYTHLIEHGSSVLTAMNSSDGTGVSYSNVVFENLNSVPLQNAGISNVQNMYVNENCEDYISVDGVLYTKDMKALVLFPAGRRGSYVIPEGVETIADGAFDFSSIERLTIPKSMKRIGDGLARALALEVIYFPNVDKQASIDHLSVFMFDDIDAPATRYKHITAVYEGDNTGDPAFQHFSIANIVKRLAAYENGYTIEKDILCISEGVVSLLELDLVELSKYSFEKVIIPASMDSVSCAYMLNTKAFEVLEGNKYLRSENGIIFSKVTGEKINEPVAIVAYPTSKEGSFETRNYYMLASSAFRNSKATCVNFIYGAVIELPNVFTGCDDLEIITTGKSRTDIYR